MTPELVAMIRAELGPAIAAALNGEVREDYLRAMDLERLRHKELLTPEEVEALYGLRVATLATWRCRGGGPDFFKRGQLIYYRNRDLVRFVEERIVKGRV